jgi:hypothetical protein
MVASRPTGLNLRYPQGIQYIVACTAFRLFAR